MFWRMHQSPSCFMTLTHIYTVKLTKESTLINSDLELTAPFARAHLHSFWLLEELEVQ